MDTPQTHIEAQRPKRELVETKSVLGFIGTLVQSAIMALSGRAKGPDVSHWEGTFDPSKASQVIDFSIMKVTEGTTYIDTLIDKIWSGVKQVAVRGAYHYLRSGMSWGLQVTHFLNIASRYDFHFYALDLEEIGNTYDDTFFSDARRWIDSVRSQTGRRVLLYTNLSTYNLFAASIRRHFSDAQAWLDDLEFWAAWPSTTATNPLLPAGRTTWTFWQFDWAGDPAQWGTGAPTDVNVFNGSPDELYAWANISKPETGGNMPTQSTEDTHYQVSDTVSSLNVRSTGENLGQINDLGNFQLTKGDILHVITLQTNPDGSRYHKFDKIWRNGQRFNVPFDGFPMRELSPSGEYWACEKGTSTFMTEVPNPEPPAPSTDAVLDIVVTDPHTGRKYGANGVKLPEIA